MTFGCGAHSETIQSAPVPVAQTVVDEVGYDEVGSLPDAEPAEQVEPEAAEPETVAEAQPVDQAASDAAAEAEATTQPDAVAPDVPQDDQGVEHVTIQVQDAEEDA